MSAPVIPTKLSGSTHHSAPEISDLRSYTTDNFSTQSDSKTEDEQRSPSERSIRIRRDIAKYSLNVSSNIRSRLSNLSPPVVSSVHLDQPAVKKLRDGSKPPLPNSYPLGHSDLIRINRSHPATRCGEYLTSDNTPLDQEPNIFERSFAATLGSIDKTNTVISSSSTLPSPGSHLDGGSGGSALNMGLNSVESVPLPPEIVQVPISISAIKPSGVPDFHTDMQVELTPKQSGIMSDLTSQSSATVLAPPSDPRAPVQHFRGGECTRRTAEQNAIILANGKSSHNRQSFEPRNNLDGWPRDRLLGLHPLEQEQLDSRGEVDTADNTANYLFLLANAQPRPQDNIGAFHGDLNPQAALRNPRGPACSSGAMVDTSCPVPSQRPLINSSSGAAMGSNCNRNISGHSIPTSVVGICDNSDGFINSSHHESQDTSSQWNRKTQNSQENISGPTSVRRKAENCIEGTAGARVKKAKRRDGQAISLSGGTCDEQDARDDENGKGTEKMTDEEKRKSFLERNRLAALKCRERKKKWIANLEEKVERFSRENAELSAQVTSFREEIVSIRTLLLAYNDCPVARANSGNISTPNRNSGTYNGYGHMTTGYYDITTCMGGGNVPHPPMGGGYY